MSFTIYLSDIAKCGPCDARYFASAVIADSVGAVRTAQSITYPNGWQATDTERVVRSNPVALLWLVSKQLVPVTFSQANAAIKKVHGDDAAEEIRKAFAAGPNPTP
jgi:hypothetical protein